jgi:hypothetical protein
MARQGPGQRHARHGAAALVVEEALERKGRHRQRQRRNTHEQQRVVVTGCLVEPKPPTSRTSVDQNPASLAADGDRDGFHPTRASSLAVTGDVLVEVLRPQTARAVVAMACTGCVERDLYTTVCALERTEKCQSRPFGTLMRDRTDMTRLLSLVRHGHGGRHTRTAAHLPGQPDFSGVGSASPDPAMP